MEIENCNVNQNQINNNQQYKYQDQESDDDNESIDLDRILEDHAKEQEEIEQLRKNQVSNSQVISQQIIISNLTSAKSCNTFQQQTPLLQKDLSSLYYNDNINENNYNNSSIGQQNSTFQLQNLFQDQSPQQQQIEQEDEENNYNQEAVVEEAPQFMASALKRNYEYADVHYWNKAKFNWESTVFQELRETFMIRQFRNNQKAIINCVMNQNDVLAIMPTGGGKSLTFQLPAVVENGITVVIMPLVSLIYDQIGQINAKQIKAYAFSADQSQEQQREMRAACRSYTDYPKMIFLTPEKICQSPTIQQLFQDLYNRQRLKRFVIDEAHCVSQWGHEFRKDYLKLQTLKQLFPSVPILALTATATEKVKIDIINQLKMKKPLYFQSSFNRPNLFYGVIPKKSTKMDDVLQEMYDFIQNNYKNQPGIVYCTSKDQCEKVSETLCKKFKLKANYYHAGVKQEKRNLTQDQWMEDDIQIIVATIAFGMGINKPNVRFVLHYAFSKSVENYYQEAGRAGRDGKRAHCVIYYSPNDKITHEYLISNNKSNNSKSKDNCQDQLNQMMKYCEDLVTCRRQQQLAYFGEIFSAEKCQKSCDNCRNAGSIIVTEKQYFNEALNILDFVYDWVTVKDNQITQSQLLSVLQGKKLKIKYPKVKQELESHKIYGSMKSIQSEELQTLLKALIQERYMVQRAKTKGRFTNMYLVVLKAKINQITKEQQFKISIQFDKNQNMQKKKKKEDKNTESNFVQKANKEIQKAGQNKPVKKNKNLQNIPKIKQTNTVNQIQNGNDDSSSFDINDYNFSDSENENQSQNKSQNQNLLQQQQNMLDLYAYQYKGSSGNNKVQQNEVLQKKEYNKKETTNFNNGKDSKGQKVKIIFPMTQQQQLQQSQITPNINIKEIKSSDFNINMLDNFAYHGNKLIPIQKCEIQKNNESEFQNNMPQQNNNIQQNQLDLQQQIIEVDREQMIQYAKQKGKKLYDQDYGYLTEPQFEFLVDILKDIRKKLFQTYKHQLGANLNIEAFCPLVSLEELARNLPTNCEQIMSQQLCMVNKLTIIQSNPNDFLEGINEFIKRLNIKKEDFIRFDIQNEEEEENEVFDIQNNKIGGDEDEDINLNEDYEEEEELKKEGKMEISKNEVFEDDYEEQQDQDDTDDFDFDQLDALIAQSKEREKELYDEQRENQQLVQINSIQNMSQVTNSQNSSSKNNQNINNNNNHSSSGLEMSIESEKNEISSFKKASSLQSSNNFKRNFQEFSEQLDIKTSDQKIQSQNNFKKNIQEKSDRIQDMLKKYNF